MDIDKIIGHSLADQSAVGCDKSAPTLWPQYLVNLHISLTCPHPTVHSILARDYESSRTIAGSSIVAKAHGLLYTTSV